MASLPETLSQAMVGDAVGLRTAGIVGLGSALPATTVASDEVAARLGVEAGWITRRTGIEARRTLLPHERISDLATLAAQRALDDAGVDGATVDLVLAATITADELMPGCAPLVAAAIGAPDAAGAMDVGAACAGFISALSLGTAMVEAGRAQTVVVIGVDALSRWLDHDDRRTAALFGDGAGAVVLQAGAAGSIGPAVLGSDGASSELIVARRHDTTIVMDGHATFKQAVRRLAEATEGAVIQAGLTMADIDVFVYHQANRRILASLTERLGLDAGRVVDAIAQVGNTSAASIPLALDDARREGRLVPGARVLIAGIGSGLVWGAAVVEWGSA